MTVPTALTMAIKCGSNLFESAAARITGKYGTGMNTMMLPTNEMSRMLR